jgi:hypothetical protein
LRRIEGTVIRIDERLVAALPTLAAKAELAELKVEHERPLRRRRRSVWGRRQSVWGSAGKSAAH